MKQMISLTANDIIIQIVPNLDKIQSDKISIPDEIEGYSIPMRLFFVDNIGKDLCGVFEISTIYYNDSIKRDIINHIYDTETKFDIYVRMRSSKENLVSPKILQIFNNVYMNGREFIVPEIGKVLTYRYYFTNTNDPWSIPIEKIEAMRPANQYIYDYAVSKAVKDLKYPIENLTKTISEFRKMSVEEKLNFLG